MIGNRLPEINDTTQWGSLRDPEILRVKKDGKNYYQVWMDYALIDEFKSRPPANRLVNWLKEN